MKKKTRPHSSATETLEFAPMDPDCVLADGLFRSLRKGARKQRLHVVYGPPEDRIEFKAPDRLGVDDMRVLQGLMALAAKQSLDYDESAILIQEPGDRIGEQLALAFEATGDSVLGVGCRLRGSFATLVRAIGADAGSGTALKGIQECLRRLCAVTVFATVVDKLDVRKRRITASIRLVSAIFEEPVAGGPGSLITAVNPKLASIALAGIGKQRTKYIRIDLREVRALTSDPARLLHQRLCGWIDPGSRCQVKLDRLLQYIWPEPAPSRKAAAWRRGRARAALRELETFKRPWTASEIERGKFEIVRPPRPDLDMLPRHEAAA